MKKIFCTLFVALLVVPVVSRAQVKEWFGATPDLKVSGKNLVDPEGNVVTLHGVMDTPNTYFNKNYWSGGYNTDQDVANCLAYFDKVMDAIHNPEKGTYCNLFRLHLDPAWTNDNSIIASGFKKEADLDENGEQKKTSWGSLMWVYTDPTNQVVKDEANICHFSMTRFKTYLQKLYIPIAKKALSHGMYVIMRPPGVFPHTVSVGDYYNEYLLQIWDVVSNDPYIQAHAGQISFELGNEPVVVNGNLADFFQPIIDKIRSNGFTGVIWAPGSTWQQEYRNYTTKKLKDDNLGFAVHFYPGWFGTISNDSGSPQSDANVLNHFKTNVPVQATNPIVITEVDWSPAQSGAGHVNESGQLVTANFGTWGTGSTSEKGKFGDQFKYVVDQCGNISWNLQGTHTYVDFAAYTKDGTIQPAFTDKMKEMGFGNASQACSGACFQWFYEYACGDQLPHGEVHYGTDLPTGTAVGNAAYKDGHYEFYTSTYSAFIFDSFKGTELTKCAELTIDLAEATIGYRLDIEILDKDGKSIVNGEYIIGTEETGTRITDTKVALKQTFNLQSLLADYIKDGNKIGKIRLNTVVSSEDTNREGKYWFTISKMNMNVSELVARQGNKGTSLADVKMYKHESTKNVVVNDDAETAKMGGWGGTITRTAGAGVNGSYGYVLTNEKTNTYEAQVSYDGTYPNGTEYTLTMDIKGASGGSMPINFQKSEGYVGCGSATVNYTTEWQTVAVPIKVTGEGANRLLFDYGGKSTLYIDNVQLYTGSDKLTEITGTNIRLGEDATNGAEVFGAGLLGNVAQNEYADLSAYNKMIIKGTGGSLRVLYNRPEEGTTPELNLTLASGEAVVDLSAYPYFHLNSIKAGWGQTVNISSITLIDGSGNNVDIADYYITGAGHITDAAQAALDDVSATVIDATGLTNVNPWSLSTANPNCLIIYKDDDQVGFTWNETTRNLVKNSNGYSAYRTNLYDGYNFRAPFAFGTVGGASYTRNLGTNTWGITVIPFALDVTADGSPEVYVLAAEDGTTLKFTKQTSGTIAAGSVILYYKENGGEAKLTGKDIAVTADGFNIQPTAVEGWYTAQSYKHQVVEDVTKDPYLKDYEVYAISGNKFVHATKKLTLKPFRALYLCKKSSNAAKSSFTISIGDTSTGIEEPRNITEIAEAQRYDVMGRKVSAPAKGISIVRMPNGTVRKVMNK